MAKKISRLDLIMVGRGLVPSRSKAQALIGAGKVIVNGRLEDKAGHNYPPDCNIEITGVDHPYVSRGGMKLAHALDSFRLDLRGLVCMDTGASTGGFTDCMLQHGAARVYAVDVGYGQLDWKLRNDPRVMNIERTNIRYMSRDVIPETVDFAAADTSFISLKLVLPAMIPFIRPGGNVVVLIKPQFEVGRKQVGRKGVVRDPALHEAVLKELESFFTDMRIRTVEVTQSPIKGARGNVEFLSLLELPTD